MNLIKKLAGIKRYVVWGAYVTPPDAGRLDTYQQVKEYEQASQCSISSIISTDDIEGVIAAVYNETDHDLKYEVLP